MEISRWGARLLPDAQLSAPSPGALAWQVYHALAAMDRTGVDAFVDVHGDETLPVAFVAGAEGCACWGPRIEALQGAFVASYARANPDMQATIGYDPDPPLEGNLAICSNQIAQRFDCLAVTLEMPFKGSNPSNLAAPGGGGTFQGPRAAALGGSLLDALAHVGPALRGTAEPAFGEADAYVAPVEDEKAVAAFVAAQHAALDREVAAVAGAANGAAEPTAKRQRK